MNIQVIEVRRLINERKDSNILNETDIQNKLDFFINNSEP